MFTFQKRAAVRPMNDVSEWSPIILVLALMHQNFMEQYKPIDVVDSMYGGSKMLIHGLINIFKCECVSLHLYLPSNAATKGSRLCICFADSDKKVCALHRMPNATIGLITCGSQEYRIGVHVLEQKLAKHDIHPLCPLLRDMRWVLIMAMNMAQIASSGKIGKVYDLLDFEEIGELHQVVEYRHPTRAIEVMEKLKIMERNTLGNNYAQSSFDDGCKFGNREVGLSMKFVQCNHDAAICFEKNIDMALAVLADVILELSTSGDKRR
jgi:hypothetical protein